MGHEQFSSSDAPRIQVHDCAVHFRASKTLVELAKSSAARRGMSLAEFMRHALRRELDGEMVTNAWPPTGSWKLTEQSSPVKRAAGGDLQSQREMIMNQLLNGYANLENWGEAIRWAEFWARLAAANGEFQDHARLLSILGLRAADAQSRGDIGTQRSLEAEGIAITSVLADEGSEEAAVALAAIVDDADAGLMSEAQALVASWKGAV